MSLKTWPAPSLKMRPINRVGHVATMLGMFFHEPAHAELFCVKRMDELANPLRPLFEGFDTSTPSCWPLRSLFRKPSTTGVAGANAHLQSEVNTRRINRIDETQCVADQYPSVTGAGLGHVRELFRGTNVARASRPLQTRRQTGTSLQNLFIVNFAPACRDLSIGSRCPRRIRCW